MTPRRRTPLILIAAMTINGCSANWQPVSAPQAKPLDAGKIIEFQAKDQLVRLHGVQFTRDSLSGIPWLEHLSCDTCRVAYPLAGVKGVRSGNPGAGAWWLLGPIIGVMAVGTAVGLAFALHGGN